MDSRSLRNLEGINPTLASVVRRAYFFYTDESRSFIVTEGLRTLVRQAELVKVGASQTMDSKHLTGDAVDLAPKIMGEVRWDWPLFRDIAVAMKRAAEEMGVVLVWGGDWAHFKDGPHFELKQETKHVA